MGLSSDYVAAIKSIGAVVEGIFNGLSPRCKFYEKIAGVGECYYCGRKNSHVCAREICPLLEEEEPRQS